MTFLNDKKPGGLEKVVGDSGKIFGDLKGIKFVSRPCSVCGDPREVPENETRVIVCPACAAIRAAAAKKEQERPGDIKRLGGLRAYDDFTLEKFDNPAAIEKCSGYPGENLFLWGASGTGKTHLATALARQYPGACVVKPQFIYRECRGIKGGADEQKAIDRFSDIPYLVIDDLGVDKKTDFSFSVLYEIIDARWMNKKTGLIITSNLSLGQLAERICDDRVVSRLNDLCKVFEITGPDRRGGK